MKRLAGLALVVTVGVSVLAYGLLNHSSGHVVQKPSGHGPSVSPPSANASGRFRPIPNARIPCNCTKPIPTVHGKIRPVLLISSGLWQGQLKAIQPTSVTVGHVTCAREAPLDLNRFRIGALVVVNCEMGQLVGIGTAPRGLYEGTVPIAPAP
jgi:hypothetical protein